MNFNIIKQTIKNLAILFFVLVMFSFSNNALAHWNSKGPYGGSVSCFAVVDTILYAGTYTGGVFKSTNKSATA